MSAWNRYLVPSVRSLVDDHNDSIVVVQVGDEFRPASDKDIQEVSTGINICLNEIGVRYLICKQKLDFMLIPRSALKDILVQKSKETIL